MTEPPPSSSRSVRRWLRFGLRTLLLVVLLVSVGLSWFVTKRNRAQKEEAAVKAIDGLGGYVLYDFQFDDSGKFDRNRRRPGPKWLHERLGYYFFSHVVRVGTESSEGVGISDAELKLLSGHLASLTRLKTLSLTDSPISDAGLESLRGLTQIEELDLSGTRVTDNGLRCLRDLRRLKTLNLKSTQVSAQGVQQLRQSLPDCKMER